VGLDHDVGRVEKLEPSITIGSLVGTWSFAEEEDPSIVRSRQSYLFSRRTSIEPNWLLGGEILLWMEIISVVTSALDLHECRCPALRLGL
jgi:hypothetical protein